MYLLKRYAERTMSVTMAYNPYVTAGFPIVIYDPLTETGDPGFMFIGQATSVNHSITKGGASTNVEITFIRMLDNTEELREPLNNSFALISDEITHQEAPMDTIYQTLLGCGVVDKVKAANMTIDDFQDDPLEAYKFNRRQITTIEQYADFIGGVVTDDLSAILLSPYLINRNDTNLIPTLEKLRGQAEANTIYAGKELGGDSAVSLESMQENIFRVESTG